MYKQDYSKYLNNNKGKKKTKKDIVKIIWMWIRLFLFLFVIISMLWGCVQMYQSKYTVSQVSDMAGNKVYSPGTTFEIVIKSLGDFGSKNHWYASDADGNIFEYSLNAISSWGEAFTETSSPFYGFFVYPMSFLLVGFVRLMAGTDSSGIINSKSSSYGYIVLVSVLFTSIIIRAITLGFTWKTQSNQEKLQMVQAKQADIQQKYKGSTDPVAKQKQQMETMALYKKEGISPMGAMVSAFLSMPFLFAMFSIVRATHALKIAVVGKITFVDTPWEQITSGNWVYLSLVVVYIPLQILSMFLPMILQAIKRNKKNDTEQQKKARKKQLIMNGVFILVFVFIIFTTASGVAIYWIFSSVFQISQTLIFHYVRETRASRIKKKREKVVMKNKIANDKKASKNNIKK
ncbi:inner membrane protein translocase component YidC [Spiroplasma corruscae]|uniref:Inner membrane protein translocase component YidC n=1 Tax=Spiroplasma corruscae TaxID=216934 RepID=A0A222EQW3_9MOLU|nr:membrane protein insertase YidC [Spiroplasma corruscae]ASP28781.1 inner membrane protein translocase component YidC [Spiroplasma corruscae]